MKNGSNRRFEQMGLAALIPGMQYMVDEMQALIVKHKAAVAAIEAAMGHPVVRAKKKIGRPRKQEAATPVRKAARARALRARIEQARQGQAQKAYWAKMTPEERRAEMQRRVSMRGK